MEYKGLNKNNLELLVFDFTMEQLKEEREFLSEIEFTRVFDFEYRENMKEANKIYMEKMKEILSRELVMPKMDFYKIPTIKLDTDHLTNIEEVWRVQQLNYLKEWNK